MTEETEVLSLEEVGRLLGRLRQPDLLRLASLARVWAIGLPRRDPADLLNEALVRVLSGQRPWPSQVPFPAFISQVMRSIASQWRHEDRREVLTEDLGDDREQPDAPVDHEFTDILERMRIALHDDAAALGVFEQLLLQTGRKQARDLLGLDETGYDTARRRMIRTLQRQFNPGWTR